MLLALTKTTLSTKITINIREHSMIQKIYYLPILGIFLALPVIFLFHQLHWKPLAIELQPPNEHISPEKQKANGHIKLWEEYFTEVSEGVLNSDRAIQDKIPHRYTNCKCK
jgi:hypothetical protein